MITVLVLILMFLILRALFHFFFSLWNTCSVLNCAPDAHNLQQNRRLFVLIPVYDEASTITDTCCYFEHTLKEIAGITVIFIGTERERTADGTNPTLSRAAQATRHLSWVTTTEAPKTANSKAAQLNYFLHQLPRETNVWLLVQDIDTRFGLHDIRSFISGINSGLPIMQRHSTFFSNWTDLSLFQRAQAFYNSRWTLTHEMTRIHLARRIPFCAHVVGHGFCINIATLYELGLFPTETHTEDCHLGFYIQAKGLSVVSTCDLQDSDCPTSFSGGFRQQVSWSYGPMNYGFYYLCFRSRFTDYCKLRRWRAVAIATLGMSTYIAWNISAYIMLVMFILLFTDLAFLSAIWWIIYILEHYLVGFLFYRIRRISLMDFAFSPAYAMLHAFPHTLAANWGLFMYLYTGEAKRHRTEHV